MKFKDLALKLKEIEKHSSRLTITNLLAQLWQAVDLAESNLVANLIQGQLQPAYDSLPFSLSEKMIARALVKLVIQNGGLPGNGLSVDIFGQADEASVLSQVRQKQRQTGDWGETSLALARDLNLNKEQDLSVTEVYQILKKIALASGPGSQEEKLNLLVSLWQNLDQESIKGVTRIVLGKLRLGFSLMTIIDSLSWVGTGSKSESSALEEIYQQKADIGLLTQSYLSLLNLTSQERLAQLKADYQVQIGIPLVPALCQRLNSSNEIIEKMSAVIAEPKYDGMRVQIHIQKGPLGVKVKAFTRSLDDVSAMFPELLTLSEHLDLKSAIFDSEAIGFDKNDGRLLPFQATMTRRRKHEIKAKSQELPMKFFIFDILYLDGQSLINLPLLARKELLSKKVSADTPTAIIAPYIQTTDPQVLHHYHQQQLNQGLEGMVAKQINSFYQSGRKGFNWVKIKEEEGRRGKLNDTLDLVVMGYYFGKGKRHQFGLGAFLVGLPGPEGKILSLTKIGTGLSDEQFRQLYQKSQPLISQTKPASYQVNKIIFPDVWLEPNIIAEIAADEITKSSFHTSGYGLRFPRLIRWREDKNLAQATDLKQLAQIKIV